jgi:hypothetical protein
MENDQEIKSLITEFLSFKFTEKSYDEESKDKLVDQFRQILNAAEDLGVQNFLDKFFSIGIDVAREFGLIEGEEESGQEPFDKEEETVEEVPEEDEEDKEEKQNESFSAYITSKASRFLND